MADKHVLDILRRRVPQGGIAERSNEPSGVSQTMVSMTRYGSLSLCGMPHLPEAGSNDWGIRAGASDLSMKESVYTSL